MTLLPGLLGSGVVHLGIGHTCGHGFEGRRIVKRWLGLTATAFLVAIARPAAAEGTLRCGVAIVSEGQYTFEVEERCGEPLFQRTHVEYRGYDIGPFWAVPVQVDEWVYDLGQVKFRRLLRFEDGVLTRISTLGRGSTID